MPLLNSSRSQEKSANAMEASGEKRERKPSKREMKASKSATLPVGAVLMAQPGEGFFHKIRRCLRLRSKGKYDFSHSQPVTDPDGGSPATRRSRSADAQANEDGDAGKLSAKSSPHKTSRSRRSKSDKEEVVLVRKDKRSSSGIKLGSKSADEGSKDEVVVVTFGENESKGEQGTVAGASGVCSESEKKESDEVFEDFDPDYETLDDIRRKVRSKADCGDVSAAPVDPATDQNKTPARQPLQVKIKASSDSNRRDSGLDSPFTDSPGSSRESQAHSVTSSVFSNSVFSDNSEHFRETTQSMSSTMVVNGVPVSTADTDPMVTSSTSSLNCSNSALEEDDLYSNAKIMIRKKSQKQSQSHTSLSTTPEQRSSGLFADQARSARNSLTPADLLTMMEAENPDPPAPPPLPARNYSEEDIATQAKKMDSPDVSSNSDLKSNKMSASGELNSSVSSETLCNGTGARPKTPKLNAFIEQGPVLTIRANRNTANRTDGELLDPNVSLPESQDAQTPLTPTNNIYEDIPARIDSRQSEAHVPLENEEKKHEDELLFMDEDLSADGDCRSDRTEDSDLPEDVMIVSASDSMCGNDTDDSQSHGTTDSSGAKEVQLHVKVSNSEKLEAGSPTVESDEKPEIVFPPKEERDAKNEILGHDAPQSESCSKSDSKEDTSDHQNQTASTPSSSSPQHLSVSSPSTASSSSASSSDTLNNIVDNDPDILNNIVENDPNTLNNIMENDPGSVNNIVENDPNTLHDIVENPIRLNNIVDIDPGPDPDDLEGKDLSPPIGPPIHISHRQLLQRLDARAKEDEPPPLPAYRPGSARMRKATAAARNVRSMEIAPGHLVEHASNRPTPPRNSRRHSSKFLSFFC